MRMTGKDSKKTTGRRNTRSPHLEAPLPLEGQSDFEQNGDDPCEVDVANDLEKKAKVASGELRRI